MREHRRLQSYDYEATFTQLHVDITDHKEVRSKHDDVEHSGTEQVNGME